MKKIIIVEDEAIFAYDLKMRLENKGYDVTDVINSSEEMFMRLGEEVPDLILMDINLGIEISGIELALKVRESHDIPIIFLTSYSDDATLIKAKETMPYGYLIKPVNDDLLKANIDLAFYRKEIESREKFLREKMQHINKLNSIGVLASGIVHEINNPNNYIMFNSSMFLDFWDEIDEYLSSHPDEVVLNNVNYKDIREDLKGLLKGVYDGSHRVKKIVEGLKEYSRRNVTEYVEAVSLAELFDSAYRILKYNISKKRINFNHTINEQIPSVKGNKIKYEQVLLNLILNALDVVDEDSGEVSVLTEKQGNFVDLIVKDNGGGIPENVREKIFDPFFTTKQKSGGTGLGLSISFSIMEDSGGELILRETSSKGTVFVMRMPEYKEEISD